MISSGAFDYINILDKAADASWQRESVIANNIANADTPGYKRQDIDFQSVLKNELGRSKYVSLDDKVKNADIRNLNADVCTEYENYSYRLDEGNVDIDTEQVELATEQINYQALITSINSEFTRLQTVLK